MPARQKIHSVLVVGIAAVFQWFFMFTKHDAGLRPIVPFGDDPYDALGSMATIVNLLLCALLLWRAFRPFARHAASAVQIQYLQRTQAAILLSILFTLEADAIAMARHPRMWIGSPSQDTLLALVAGMAAFTGVGLGSIHASLPAAKPRAPKTLALIVAAMFILILAAYPEAWIVRLPTHLVTVLVGDLLLFVPVSVFLRLVIPNRDESEVGRSVRRGHFRRIWAAATLASVMIGITLFVAEMRDGGPMPPLRLRLFVASVYIGLTLAGVLIALAFLKPVLGLGRNTAKTS